MKKIIIAIAALAALVSFNSCKKEIERIQMPTEEGYMYTFVLKDVVTSATLDNGGVSWESTDKVGMYLEGYTGYAEINTETTPNTAILYSPSIIPANSYAYAYYPYDSGNDDKTSNHIFLPNVQEGGSSSAMPLASIPFKIESEVAAKARPNGAIQFLNLGSVIDFRIYSSTYSSETIEYVTFTATSKKTLAGVDTDLAVSGDGYLDLTAIDTHDDTTVDLLFGLGTDYDYARVHNLSVAVADSKANATIPIYLVVAPGIYTGTITIGTDAATYTFDYSNKTLERNGIKKYNMNLDNADRVAGVVETVMPLPYSETFATSIGDFTTDGEQVASTDVWSQTSGYLMASAYVGGNRYATTSWAYSPWIDLTGVAAAYVTFEHVYRYTDSHSTHMTLWVMTDEGGADWEQLTIPTYSSGTNWTFVSSGEILLNSYVGHKVKLAFKYISGGTGTSDTGTWEIKNLHVAEKVYTTSFTWDADDLEVEVGKSKSNHVTVNSGATITYDSDDTDIATVAADGTVTGVAEGSTTINVHVAANGNYPAKDDSFDVTVIPAAADKVYNLVTSYSELTVGSKVIIAAIGDSDYAAGIGTTSATFIPAISQAKSADDSKITNPDADVDVFTIEAGGAANTIALHGTNGYLYAKSSSSNYIGIQTTNDVNGYWTPTIVDAGTGEMSLVATGSSNRNHIHYNYNNGDPRFSCYASSSPLPLQALYKLEGSGNGPSLITTYTVTYNGNGNTGGSAPASVVTTGAFTVAMVGTLVKTGYNFTGWNTAADGSGTAYAAGASAVATANVTLYAQWTISGGGATWTRVTSVATLLAGGTFIIGYEATANSGIIVPMANTGSATTSKAGYMYSGSTASDGGSATINMASVATTTSFEVTIGSSSSVDGAIYIKIGDNYLGNTNTKNNCKLFDSEANTTSFTPTIGDNDTFTLDIAANTSGNAYRYLKYNTGAPRFAVYATTPEKIVIYKKN